ncbi:MAG: endonuclease [Prevotellaceae bacterium]|jgi:endonuclease I|nr:endonuclease [Prevotellaceae bacterium]
MKRIFFLPVAALCFFLWTAAAPPALYYASAEGYASSSLRTKLYDIIKGHTVISYDGLWTLYATTDKTADDKIWDMYSTCSFTYGTKQCGSYSSVCDCYNREHSIPKSWFNDASPMYSDAFHVYPTDGKVNGQRSNYPFGECANGTSLGSKALGKLGSSTFTGYSGTVFEPDDEYKGDFARTYFYMATRYANICANWGNDVFGSNNGLTAYAVNLFLKWHRQDPVSLKETDRNDAVYARQRNRNPFIDHPELAEYIWGNRVGQSWQAGSALDESFWEAVEVLPNPASDFVTVKCGSELPVAYSLFNLAGELLRQGVTVSGSRISLSMLPSGVYLMQLTIADRRLMKKIVIAKSSSGL